ncbi:MAG: YlxR family protein [Mariprofundaceae bacterium]|nr:YlxR family protein [Mariprofundaceae bacterium]
MTDSKRKAERSCLVCRRQAEKTELLRLVVDENAQVLPDVLQKAPGRGAYICWQNACFKRLNDKQLLRAWKNTSVAAGQGDILPQRVKSIVRQLCRQALQQRRKLLSIGRDAVMHRMWVKTPMLLFLAGDAGAALARQVHDACDKRQASGLKTALVIFGDSATLGDLVQRGVVSVLAMDDSPACMNLRKYCLWYGQLRNME